MGSLFFSWRPKDLTSSGAKKDPPPTEQASVTADSTLIKSITELGWRWAEGD